MTGRTSLRFKQAVIVIHRWLGVALCLIFLIWFPSGIVLMYWDFPSVTPADRLERAPTLVGSAIHVAPEAAAAKAGVPVPDAVRVNTFDGRPVYRVDVGPDELMFYADTGEEAGIESHEMMGRIASAWSGLPVGSAVVTPVTDVDQWTLQLPLAALQPVWKYSWADNQQVYISEATGEVVQYTTAASRRAAYLGAIPHWLYFTPLRKHAARWSRIVIWTSGLGTFAAIAGVVIGVWAYSPSRRYRISGTARHLPYRGQKRWHTIFGLLFGIGAVTWAFSGMLSMDPLPIQRRRGGPSAPAVRQALRQPIQLERFGLDSLRRALNELEQLKVKQLEMVVFAGEPVYLATLAGGASRVMPVHGTPGSEFARDAIADVVTKAAGPDVSPEVRILDHYDSYYLDRRRERPLPVLLFQLHDAEQTRYYIDPKTAQVVGSYRSSGWVTRWLYHALHSLDFPFLYDHRPLWDLVVITFMAGGSALSITALILAWRVLVVQKLFRMTQAPPL